MFRALFGRGELSLHILFAISEEAFQSSGGDGATSKYHMVVDADNPAAAPHQYLNYKPSISFQKIVAHIDKNLQDYNNINAIDDDLRIILRGLISMTLLLYEVGSNILLKIDLDYTLEAVCPKMTLAHLQRTMESFVARPQYQNLFNEVDSKLNVNWRGVVPNTNQSGEGDVNMDGGSSSEEEAGGS